jgi:tetratricopeptide (TPR) repeat protein
MGGDQYWFQFEGFSLNECLVDAITLDQSGRYEVAIGYFNRAIKLKSDDVDAYFNKGRALYQLGRNEAAIECCNIITQLLKMMKE